MKLKKLSKYFYRHPKALLNGTFILSVALHAAILIQIPFLKFTSLPAQKAKTTIINVSLQNLKVHSETSILKKKIEKPKGEKKEVLKEMVKKEDVIPYLKKEEEKEEPKKDQIQPQGFIPQEEKKEVLKEIVKKDNAIPYLKEDHEKKEPKKDQIQPQEFIPPPPSVSKDITINAERIYGDRISKRINEMKHYPMYARRMNREGVVKIKFVLKSDGTLKENVVILKKCSHEILNKAAVRTVVKANPYPPFPDEIKKDEIIFIIDVDFHLEVW